MTAPWPQPDPAALELDEIEYVVQVNGVKRGTVRVAKTTDKASLERVVKSLDFVKRHIEDKVIKRFVVVPGKLVNIVV